MVSIAIVILFLCNPGLCYIGSVGFTLLITALLFCPGANKWFVSWPRGWSYWPVLLVIAQIVTMLINQSTFERGNTNSKDGAASLPKTRYTRQVKNADTNIDYVKAPIEKVLEAAQNGIVDAQVNLGLRYATGKGGVEKDQYKSFSWYRRAAVQGDASAQYMLGRCYEEGMGASVDKAEAVRWYRMSAEQGNVEAQFHLATCLYFGDGVLMNQTEGARWYRKAAEKDYSNLSSEELDARLADIDRQLAELDAQTQQDAQTPETAYWPQKPAEEMSADERKARLAQIDAELARLDRDAAVKRQAIQEATRWYRKAAEQGDARAQYMLGRSYASGAGVSVDNAEAVKWYRKAARQGYGDAQKILQEKGLSW